MYLCEWMAHECRCPQVPEGVGSPRTGITGGLGAVPCGQWELNQVFCKMVVGYLMRMLGMELVSSGRSGNILNH